MPERTAKKLAQRIDLGYLRRPHPFRRWRFWLSVAAPAVALLWLGWLAVRGDNQAYIGGAMSSAHAAFAEQCSVCHLGSSGIFRRHAADEACLACHDGPVHRDNQTFTPACGDCHVEHRGTAPLAHTADVACTQCHARLETRGGSPRVERAVAGFARRHPEFAPLRNAGSDPGAVKLNHEVHLKPNLRGPRGPVQMECSDCHRLPGESGPWPYADEKQPPAPPTAAPVSSAPVPAGAYMVPMRYARQCAACHPLLFDPRITEPAPHEKPEVVRAFVERKLRDYIGRHPEEIGRSRPPERRLPGEPRAEAAVARTPGEWVALRMAEAERLLWNKTCKECHTLRFPAGRPPEVAPPAIPARWLRRAVFSHTSHAFLVCTACHVETTASKETADVLLPSIDTCRQCHQSGRAEARCFQCHVYHDWSRGRPIKGRYTLPQVGAGD